MKLNAAAVLVLSLIVFVFPGAALALDDIDLSNPPDVAEEGPCSRLYQIKYPFLACGESEVGSPDEEPTWENTRRIPRRSEFIEGDGYWGPSLNE